MKNFKNPTDAEVRRDFPGGWKEDAVNKFTAAGRTVAENGAFNHIKALAGFRKTSSAIGSGQLMQFLPKEGLYTYLRYDKQQTVMVISNTGDKKQQPDLAQMAERVEGFTKIRNVISGEIAELKTLELKPKESFVFELLK
jgi:glycosidase